MINSIPTGFAALDNALNIGGIPCGQITEIAGEESSGKTTLCQHIIAQAQLMNGICAFIDTDYSFDPSYAAHCGVWFEQLYLSRPASAEEALDIANILTRSGAFKVIVVDSLTKMVPLAELTTPIGAPIGANFNRLLAHYLPPLFNAIHGSESALVLTNQGISGMSAVYHQLESNLPRLALSLHAAVRLKLEPLTDPGVDQPVRRIQARIIKNKFASCFKTIELDIIVNRGNEKIGDFVY